MISLHLEGRTPGDAPGSPGPAGCGRCFMTRSGAWRKPLGPLSYIQWVPGGTPGVPFKMSWNLAWPGPKQGAPTSLEHAQGRTWRDGVTQVHQRCVQRGKGRCPGTQSQPSLGPCPPACTWNPGTDCRGVLMSPPPPQGPGPCPESRGPASGSCPPPATTRCAQENRPPPAALSPTPTPAWTAAGRPPRSQTPGPSTPTAPPARTLPASRAAGSSSPSLGLCEAGILTASWMP